MINNLEKSTIVCDMFIKVDEDNKVLIASDIINKENMNLSNTRTLKKVNSYIALKIEDQLNINIVDYGIEIFDKCLSISNEELNAND